MRRLAPIFAISVLALAGACGSGSGDAVSAGSSPGADAGLDVCGLVSDDTVNELQSTSVDEQGKPVETLMTQAELFVECRINAGVEVSYAVRGAPGGPDLESLVDGAYGEPAEPLPGVGDEALIGTNSYDGVRITARVGDQELVVDSEASGGSGEGEIGRDVVIALATEVAGGLGDEKPAAVRLPSECPSTSDEVVKRAVGTALVARGTATDGGVACSYVGDARMLKLSAGDADRGMSLMAQADSPEQNRTEVDGDPALYDDRDGVIVFAGRQCVLGASASPVGWGLADNRPAAKQRDEDIELVKFVKESIGCP